VGAKISPVPDCLRSGRARGDSASAFGAGAVCRRVLGSNPGTRTFCHLFAQEAPGTVPEPLDASNGSLVPRLNINFIARPQINLGDCTGPLSVRGQSNHCQYLCPKRQKCYFLSGNSKFLFRHDTNSLTVRSRISSPGCRIRTVRCCRYPPPKHNAGKCNRGCYAHFKADPMPKYLVTSSLSFLRNPSVLSFLTFRGYVESKGKRALSNYRSLYYHSII
jgi:hypothetical protein